MLDTFETLNNSAKTIKSDLILDYFPSVTSKKEISKM